MHSLSRFLDGAPSPPSGAPDEREAQSVFALIREVLDQRKRLDEPDIREAPGLRVARLVPQPLVAIELCEEALESLQGELIVHRRQSDRPVAQRWRRVSAR